MTKIRGLVSIIFLESKYYRVIAILTIAALVVGVVLVYAPRKRGMDTEVTEFKIESGQTLSETARFLAEKNLIYNRLIFVAYAVLSGHERDFKAGRYLIPQLVSTRGLVDIFSRGLSESEDVVITIPEGSNIADIDLIFAKTGLTKPSDFLKPDIIRLEGYFFPDTYRFPNPQIYPGGASVSEIMKKLQDNFEKKAIELGLNNMNIGQEIITASILEKEVKTEQDMRLVAGIIQKRIRLNMSLEIDATVAYGVCLQKFLLGKYCDVSLANIVDNIAVDSAYNTYKRRGLPVGPISNPGLTALSAALNPQPSDYLYYLSTKDGTTIFSKTAAEHLRARRKYLK